MIEREIANKLRHLVATFPVVTIEGPRQSGKTMLARMVFPDYAYANLEDGATRRLAERDPQSFFEKFPCPAIVDEIQRVPDLLSAIAQVLDESDSRLSRSALKNKARRCILRLLKMAENQDWNR